MINKNPKCIFYQKGKCSSDYGNKKGCNGITPRKDCPYGNVLFEKEMKNVRTK